MNDLIRIKLSSARDYDVYNYYWVRKKNFLKFLNKLKEEWECDDFVVCINSHTVSDKNINYDIEIIVYNGYIE